jgi:hypothetical protein
MDGLFLLYYCLLHAYTQAISQYVLLLAPSSVGAMDFNHLAQYFKQEKFSDIDLIIHVPKRPSAIGAEPRAKRQKQTAAKGKLLARFPAHRVVLAGTDYFKAQVGLLMSLLVCLL